jgi:hypothetical protein
MNKRRLLINYKKEKTGLGGTLISKMTVSSRPDLKKKKKIEEVKDFKSRVSRQKTE